MENCTFVSNWSENVDSHAGAIFLDDSEAPAVFRNCTFTANTAVDLGGVLYAEGQIVSVEFYDCVFVTNTARTQNGGAVNMNVGHLCDSLRFVDCIFSNNVAGGEGGAVWIGDNVSGIVFTNCTFTGNESSAAGGAIRANNGADRSSGHRT